MVPPFPTAVAATPERTDLPLENNRSERGQLEQRDASLGSTESRQILGGRDATLGALRIYCGRDLETSVGDADPGLRVTAVGLGWMPDDGEIGWLHGLCYPWDQDTLGIAGPIDNVPLEDLEQRFTTVVKVQPRLATAHAKLFTHVLSLLIHALGEHRKRRQSETPDSLLWGIKLWYILPALLHSQGGRVKRRERFASVERGDVTLLLPWLMGYTRRTCAR